MRVKSYYLYFKADLLKAGSHYSFDIYHSNNIWDPLIFLNSGEKLNNEQLKFMLETIGCHYFCFKYIDADKFFSSFDIEKEEFLRNYNKNNILIKKHKEEIESNPLVTNFSVLDELRTAVIDQNYFRILKQVRAEIIRLPFNRTGWISTIKVLSDEILRRNDFISSRAALNYIIAKTFYRLTSDHLVNLIMIGYLSSFKKIFQNPEAFKENITLLIEEINLDLDARVLMFFNEIDFQKMELYQEIIDTSDYFLSLPAGEFTDEKIRQDKVSTATKTIAFKILTS